MYAVVNTGGKQYKVREGEVHRFEKIPGEVGSTVSFDRVLMVSDGENVQVGQPVVPDMAVRGHVVEQGKARKVLVFKYKRRKRYRRKLGHRQQFTAVRIDRIGGPDTEAEETPAVEAGAVDTPVEAQPDHTPETEEGAPEAPTTTEE
jgi:large subunit ribosomal protein L21